MSGDLTPYGERPPAPGLADLRVAAEDLAKQERWDELVALRPELEADVESWTSLWAPLLAVAARRVGRREAFDLLVAAVDDGFRQEWLFDDLLETTFGADQGWAQLRDRMAGPVSPPSLELLAWPSAPPMLPLVLDRVPDGRDAELAARLPTSEATAWGTARRLLDWVAHHWAHANDHVARADALDVLDQVQEKGARFACVEYSIVLSQALNAVGIPARRLSLRTRDHHTGLGRGHVASEAWVDELARWVLLDGQNGSYWVDEHDEPLGVLQLQQRYRDGTPARFVAATTGQSVADATVWASYFASASTTGVGWSEGAYVPVFQDVGVLATPRLLTGPDGVAPNLASLWTGVVRDRDDGAPAVTFTSVHPYATGVRVTTGDGTTQDLAPGERWQLPGLAGEHAVEVATTTPYAVLAPSALRFVRR